MPSDGDNGLNEDALTAEASDDFITDKDRMRERVFSEDTNLRYHYSSKILTPGASLARAMANDATPMDTCFRRISEAENALADVRRMLNGLCKVASSEEKEDDKLRNGSWILRLEHPDGSDPSRETSVSFRIYGDSSDSEHTNKLGVETYGTSSKLTRSKSLRSKALKKGSTMLSKEDQETVMAMTQGPHTASPDKVQELIELCNELEIDKEGFEQVVDFFETANISGNGKMSLEELGAFIEDMCEGTIMPNEVEEIVSSFDDDQDGKLTLTEFIRAFHGTAFIQAAHVGQQLSKVGQAALSQLDENKMKDDTLAWVTKVGVHGKTLRKYIKKEMKEASACLSLPLTLVMFIMFLVSFDLHFSVERAHAVDQSIIWDVLENANFAFSGSVPLETGRMGHKNLENVNSAADFWSWFNLGIVPLFWPQGWDISEVRANVLSACLPAHTTLTDLGYGGPYHYASSSAHWDTGWNLSSCPEGADIPQRPTDVLGNGGPYLLYHSVIGGLRLRQERSDIIPCPSEDKFVKAVYPGRCIGNNGYWLEPELDQALYTDTDMTNKTGGETVHLLSGWTQEKVRQHLRDLENKVWLSPETTKVELLFTTYNPHMNVLTATYIMFFMNRGGHIYKIIEPTSFWMEPYESWGSIFTDITLALLFLKIVLEEGLEMAGNIANYGCRRGLRKYISPANFVDLLSVVYFCLLILLWLQQISRVANLRNTMARADWQQPGSWTDPQIRSDFYDDVDTLSRDGLTFRTIIGFFPYILGCRFLKACAAQPRLAVMTNTLKKSSKDLFHFFVVFGCVFTVYSMSALILFGTELEEFSNVGRAVSTVFQVVQGDYDWHRMTRIGRIQAGLWFFSFECIVIMCMLNMLLAIIMDVYTDVKGNVHRDAETLWSQAAEIFQRWRAVRRGEELPLESICDALSPPVPSPLQTVMNCLLRKQHVVAKTKSGNPVKIDSRVTVEQFKFLIPNLPEDQAKRLLLDAHKLDREEKKAGSALSDNAKMNKLILRNTEVMHGAIARLININQMHSAIMRANHLEIAKSVKPPVPEAARRSRKTVEVPKQSTCTVREERNRSVRYNEQAKVSEMLGFSMV